MLIKCSECGKDVSDNAATCVHCGYPLMQKKESMIEEVQSKRKDGLVIASNVILGVFAFLIFYGVLMSKGGVEGNGNAAMISWFLMVGTICAVFTIKKSNKITAKISGISFIIAVVVSALSVTTAFAYVFLVLAILLNVKLFGKYLKKNKIY